MTERYVAQARYVIDTTRPGGLPTICEASTAALARRIANLLNEDELITDMMSVVGSFPADAP